MTKIRRSEHYAIITTSDSTSPAEFSEEVVDVLNRIPRRIISPFCESEHNIGDIPNLPDEFEGYLSPDIEMNFRVNPIFFRRSPDDMIFKVSFFV